jgi:hypothetical protein
VPWSRVHQQLNDVHPVALVKSIFSGQNPRFLPKSQFHQRIFWRISVLLGQIRVIHPQIPVHHAITPLFFTGLTQNPCFASIWLVVEPPL